MLLNKSQLLAHNDLPFEDVPIPEIDPDAVVRVGVMSGLERDAWEADVFQEKGHNIEVNKRNFRASLIARCLRDENGPIDFTPEEVLDLGRKSSVVIDRLYTVAARINKISKSDQDELTKN